MTLGDLELVLFFTGGTSLAAWDEARILEREVAIYRRLSHHLGGVTFVTHGDAGDLDYRSRLDGIRIVCNRFRQRPAAYLAGLPWRFLGRRGSLVVKSNQVFGADSALAFASQVRRPFIARCGYLLSDFAARQHGDASVEAASARVLERKLFQGADRCVVTSEAMCRRLSHLYGLDNEKVSVIPNYVDTELFAPDPNCLREPDLILFIGRLEPQKNLGILIEAVAACGLRLAIIGEGSLRPELERQIAERGARAQLLGTVPHTTLPDRIRRAAAFVLPSLYEGHPKTLLEAMACGAPVIGTNVPGISEVIDHGRTGLLAEPTANSLAAALRSLVEAPGHAARLGANARLEVARTLSLDAILAREIDLLRSVTALKPARGRLVPGISTGENT